MMHWIKLPSGHYVNLTNATRINIWADVVHIHFPAGTESNAYDVYRGEDAAYILDYLSGIEFEKANNR